MADKSPDIILAVSTVMGEGFAQQKMLIDGKADSTLLAMVDDRLTREVASLGEDCNALRLDLAGIEDRQAQFAVHEVRADLQNDLLQWRERLLVCEDRLRVLADEHEAAIKMLHQLDWTGPAGPAGRDGLDGIKGADGSPGPAGLEGQAGAPGPQGDTRRPGRGGPAGRDGTCRAAR
jgi:hypothetical protein